jgi:hypothetical protein
MRSARRTRHYGFRLMALPTILSCGLRITLRQAPLVFELATWQRS